MGIRSDVNKYRIIICGVLYGVLRRITALLLVTLRWWGVRDELGINKRE